MHCAVDLKWGEAETMAMKKTWPGCEQQPASIYFRRRGPPCARESGCGETCPTGHRVSCCAGSRRGQGNSFQVVPWCEKVMEKSPSTNIFRHSSTELHPEYCRTPSGRVQRATIYKMFYMLFTNIIDYVLKIAHLTVTL